MNVANFVADYLETKYHYPHIYITEGCCRRCLRGTPVKHSLEDTSFSELMEKGILEPHQAASSFYSGSKFHAACFTKEAINVNSPQKQCKYPRNCELKCILCRTLIENDDGIELPHVWPGFTAHKKCLSPCAHPCCRELLPALPIYMCPQRSDLRCNAHKDAKARRVKPLDIRLNPATPIPKAMIYQPPKPISLPQPLPEPRVVPPEPAVKKTFAFKKPPAKARADKFDERGKSRNILAFFHSNEKKTSDLEAAAVMQSAAADPPRRFIRNSKTQEIFGYWQGDCAYHIETGEPLANFSRHARNPPANVKFDFTPPKTLTSSPDIEEQQHEGKASA